MFTTFHSDKLSSSFSSFSASDFKCWLEFKYLNKRKVCNISNISKSVLKQHFEVHVTDIRKLLNNLKKLILLVLSFWTLWVAFISRFLQWFLPLHKFLLFEFLTVFLLTSSCYLSPWFLNLKDRYLESELIFYGPSVNYS